MTELNSEASVTGATIWILAKTMTLVYLKKKAILLVNFKCSQGCTYLFDTKSRLHKTHRLIPKNYSVQTRSYEGLQFAETNFGR